MYGKAAFLYLSHSAVVIPFESARPLPTREKGGDESDPPQKAGGHVTLDSATEYGMALSRPHGVALVLIYPCGKAQKQPPGAALKARRRVYEMARGRPLSPGALAPARWPDELEKPDPGFGRRGLAGVSRFGALGLGRMARVSGFDALGLGRVSRRAIRCSASGSGDLFFRRSVVRRVELCAASFPALDENPLLDLMNYHTPYFYCWVLLWYYVSPFVVVMLSGLVVLTVWKVWLEGRRRDFAPFAKLPPWPPRSQTKGPGHRHRGGPSPGRGAGDFQSLVAHHPGAGPLYRSGDLRSRGIGENLGLHEPVCPAASRLASGQSADAGGGAGARSQGRFLSRHPPNPGRGGPRKRTTSSLA